MGWERRVNGTRPYQTELTRVGSVVGLLGSGSSRISLARTSKEVLMDEAKNDFAVTPVPLEHRRPVSEITFNLAGGSICVAALLAGAALAESLSFWECFIAVLLAGALLTLLSTLIGGVGMRTGLSTGMLLQRTFGKAGASLVALTFATCLVGWYAVQTSFFGAAMHSLFPNGGFLTEPRSATVWGGLLMLTTALVGYKGLSLLSRFAVPLLVVLCIWGTARVIGGADLTVYTPPKPLGIGFGVTMVVGALAVGATITPDLTRYARGRHDPLIACSTGYMIVNSFMMLTGAGTVIATSSGDLLSGMLALGLGVPAVLILVLGQWMTNDDNLYSASLAVASVKPGMRKASVVAVLGVAATLAAALGVADYFVPFLIALGVCIPPVGGILIADWVMLKRPPKVARLSLPALAAWGLGTVTGFVVPVGIATLNATVVAMLAYLAARRFESRSAA